MIRESLLSEITQFYLRSHDFNGLPARVLLKRHDDEKLVKTVSDLVSGELITVVFGDYHPNPHIKALPSESVEEQVTKVQSEKFRNACLYPAPKHLQTVVDANQYLGRPFALCLALGEPQLAHKSFDLAVLEIYRNDPRYHYGYDDIHGDICIGGEFYEKDDVRQSDQILLESFGFSFDNPDVNIYVAVFLRYLYNLSSEHQQIWASKQVHTKTYLHPDYHRTAIIGDWPERVSLYQAVLMEMQTANRMGIAMGRPAFWRDDFRDGKRPREFGYLLRPTLKDFHDFVHLFDKMLSDNINRDFFQSEVPFEYEEPRPGGRVEVKQKGTIQILDDWLKQAFQTPNRSSIEEMLKTLRTVRSLRAKPAHAIKDNVFDQKYIREQRQLMKSVYRAVKIIRLTLARHPSTQSIEIDRHLEEGLIWAL